MVEIPSWFVYMALGAFGLVFGSFANVVIWRLPRGESLASPSSHCPSCNQPIRWHDNIPLASWIVLRGRCRECGSRISLRYPVVELLSGALWIVAGAIYGVAIRLPFGIVLLYLMLILAFIDVDARRLPNVLVGTLAVAGVIGVFVSELLDVGATPLMGTASSGLLASPAATAVLGVVLGAGMSLAVAATYRAIRNIEGLGMGDVKLLGALGLYFGPYVVMVYLLGNILGALGGVISSRVTGESLQTAQVPFGAYVAVASLITVAAGPALWEAYARAVGM